jgi:hypothetical protein
MRTGPAGLPASAVVFSLDIAYCRASACDFSVANRNIVAGADGRHAAARRSKKLFSLRFAGLLFRGSTARIMALDSGSKSDRQLDVIGTSSISFNSARALRTLLFARREFFLAVYTYSVKNVLQHGIRPSAYKGQLLL